MKIFTKLTVGILAASSIAAGMTAVASPASSATAGKLTIWENTNFGGNYLELTLNDVHWGLNIDQIKLANQPLCAVYLPTTCSKKWNDRVTTIYNRTVDNVCFYEHVDMGGRSIMVKPGGYIDLGKSQTWFNDKISSIKRQGDDTATSCSY